MLHNNSCMRVDTSSDFQMTKSIKGVYKQTEKKKKRICAANLWQEKWVAIHGNQLELAVGVL